MDKTLNQRRRQSLRAQHHTKKYYYNRRFSADGQKNHKMYMHKCLQEVNLDVTYTKRPALAEISAL